MRTLIFMAALLVSSAASAQVTFKFGTARNDALRFGRSSCDAAVTVTWTRTVNACAALSLWLTRAGACATTINTSGGDVAINEVSQTTFLASQTGTFTFTPSSLPFDTTGGAAGCGALEAEVPFFLCGSTRQADYLGTCNTAVNATGGKVTYDGKPPTAPTFSSVVGLDGAASISLTAPSDAITGEVVVFLGSEEVRRVAWRSGQGAVLVEGLDNGVTYQVEATVSDEAGNVSPPSARVDVIPTATFGYMSKYIEAGGQETGGCGAAGGGFTGGAMLAALGFWLFSRRNRSWLEQ
ncbi:MAG: MXAN_2561 family MXYO-CTERM-anchored protein [Cystobacter sp.]